ncbi:MAG: V-type ATP synthase subunit E family protein [Pseudomonadota bacterium]|nr:V-type ATP synthase subunit E family protein [Pseudomonadota bacterium]
MSQDIEQLATAIQQRAKSLADSHLTQAQQQRDNILEEAHNRLQQREQQEVQRAKTAGERLYRQQVQASEIKMQTELDQLRWQLVEDIMAQLRQQLTQLTQAPERYLDLLTHYFLKAVALFEDSELVAEVNEQDYQWLKDQWDELVKDKLSEKNCTLAVSEQPCSGGILVHNQMNRIRIDNTFEGLISRLEQQIYQTITTQLLASATAIKQL